MKTQNAVADSHPSQQSRRLLANIATSSWTRIAGLVLSLLTTPVLFNTLGSDQFGLYALLGSLALYAGVLDFGIGPSLIQHFTAYGHGNDRSTIRHIVTFSLGFYLVLGGILAVLTSAIAPWLVSLLSVSPRLEGQALACIDIIPVYFTLAGIAGIFSSRIVSLHRMDLVAIIDFGGVILSAGTTLLLLPHWPHLWFAIAILLGQILVTGLAKALVVIRADRRVLSNPKSVPWPLVRKLLLFGGWMQLNGISALINLEADKLIIGSVASMDFVGFYQVGNRLAALNRIIPLQLLGALMPKAAEIGLRRDDAFAAFYADGTRYLMLTTCVITGFVVATADQLVTLWLGHSIPIAAGAAVALALSFAINNLTGIGTALARSSGFPRYETYYAWTSTLINIGLTVALARPYGIPGILAGTIVGNVIGSVFFVVLFHRKFQVDWTTTIGTWLWRLLVGVGMGVAVLTVMRTALVFDMASTRAGEALWLALEACAYAACVTAALGLVRFWTPQELGLAARVSPARLRLGGA